MAHKNDTAFVGTYDTVDAASADFDAVSALHHGGGVGHLEAAVLSRDHVGKLSWDRHEKLGGIHLSHAPSDELVRLSDRLAADAVALVVIGSADDSAAVARAAAGARDPRTEAVEHPGMAEGYFAGGGGAAPGTGEETGFEDGSVGHLGV